MYECDVVGTIKAASDKVKEAKSPHKLKVEKSIKPETTGENGDGGMDFSFKEEN
jgi:hypothetical protein